MKFTYMGYSKLLNSLIEGGYSFVNYSNALDYPNEKKVVLRHDIDSDLGKATTIAKIESDYGVKATYFILPRTEFYNIFSPRSSKAISKIISLGHEIGLHFDETNYEINSIDAFKEKVEHERKILELATNKKISSVSMHRPSRFVLESDIHFETLINSYSKEFFQNWKYISDSRMHWREDVLEIINSGEYNKLHILTHPFWYQHEEKSTEFVLKEFIMRACIERYNSKKENFRDLEEFVKLGDLFND